MTTISVILERCYSLQTALRNFPTLKNRLKQVMGLYESHENVLRDIQESLEKDCKHRSVVENDIICNFLRSVSLYLGKANSEICAMKECKAFGCASSPSVSGGAKSKTSKVVKGARKVLTKSKTGTFEALNVTN